MEAAAATGHDATAVLFSVKEEPLDFDLMVKVEGDLELDLGAPEKPPPTTVASSASSAVPQIGSSNSAFQPYKVSLTKKCASTM